MGSNPVGDTNLSERSNIYSPASLLLRYIRPVLGERLLSTIAPLDVPDTCQRMIDRGLSPRTVRYTHSVLRSAMR